jgi:Pentapeptide repeats (8 copies)
MASRSTLAAMSHYQLPVAVALTLSAFIGACATGEPPPDMRRDARVPPSPDLGRSDLGPVDLGGADLGGADLGGADLGTADLGGADLGGADLGTADLGGADLGMTPDAGPSSGYRHTITIDGVNDFDAARDRFATTTLGYTAYLSWDDTGLYLGMDGTDVGSGDGTRWFLVYLDTNGAGFGTSVGVTYRTQTPALPSGFLADYAFRWRADNLFQGVQRWDSGGSTWVDDATVTAITRQTGTFVETRISLTDVGTPGTIGVAAFMLNETDLAEYSFAGVPSGTFADGYYPTIPMTGWISADRALSTNPNDPTRLRP